MSAVDAIESHSIVTMHRVYGWCIAGLTVLTVWGLFDIHRRLPFVLAGQAVVLGLRAIWKMSR